MGLATDSIFMDALKSNSELMSQINGRLYPTAILLPDAEAENVPVPYLLVTFDGLTNDQDSKDDPFESASDKVTVSIFIVAKNRSALADLAQAVRTTIHDYMTQQLSEDENFPIQDYEFTAESVRYEASKPCHWQVFTYVCDVNNDEQ